MNRLRMPLRLVLPIALLVLGVALAQPYGEAPSLAERVAAGDLPPVEERLPEEPMVVDVVEEIGDYGGTWRTALLGGADNSWLNRTMGFDKLVRFAPNSTRVIPDIAESFEVSDDATEFTFHLREGLKWSDGQPYTADDIMFWWDDIAMNEAFQALNPIRSMYVVGGEPMTVEKVDDYTVVFRFATPNALFLQQFADRNGFEPTRFPRHYLERFHPAYNPAVDELVAEYGQDDWVALMDFIVTREPAGTGDPDMPVLTAWDTVTRYGEDAQVIAERNPYYYKVDPEGNQLPYLDRIIYDVLEDREVLVLKALNGEISFMDRHIATPDNKAVFFDNQETGGYELIDTVSDSMNMMNISFNLNHQDPVKRQVFQDKDFRIALSHAIDRQEMIDLVYVGQGEPWQLAPRPESEFFDEAMAKQYTEYDPELSNQILDEAGYGERDGQGYRLGPDGNRIAFVVEVSSGQQDRIDMLELIQGYWEEIGIDMQVRTEDRSLLYTRKDAGQHDAVVWGGDGGLLVMTQPRYYFPFSNESNYAPAWAAWFNDPSGVGADIEPEEPPEQVRRQMELYRELRQTGDAERQQELMREILAIAEEQFYAIGTVLPGPGYAIKKTNFRNVPDGGITFHQYPSHLNPSQFFLEGGTD